jgi:hypothetical protein
MDSSFTSIIAFIIMTIFYYMALKPKLKIADLGDPTSMGKYTSTVYQYLGIYYIAVVAIQVGINASMITSKCGGSVSKNIGAALLITIIPWILIFGILIAVLIMFPGFKSAFSDVIGYFAVSGSANKVLTELLVDVDLNKTIDSSTQNNPTQNAQLKDAAQAVLKLCGDMSILINQIAPSNFSEYWKMLTPLMKPTYQTTEPLDLKQKLLDIVVLKDNIGEAMWYTYTAILLISITQYAISIRSCNTDVATMQQKQALYKEQQQAIDAENEKSQSAVYTSS